MVIKGEEKGLSRSALCVSCDGERGGSHSHLTHGRSQFHHGADAA